MAAIASTPAPRKAEGQSPPTAWESEGLTNGCHCLMYLGAGADMRLCCRPWARTARVLDGIEEFQHQSVIGALYGMFVTLLAYFWAASVLLNPIILSAVGLFRNTGYLIQAWRILKAPGLVVPCVLVAWTGAIVLQAGALGCTAFVLHVACNLDSITAEQAQLFEPLFWAGGLAFVLANVASAAAATGAIHLVATAPTEAAEDELASETRHVPGCAEADA